MAQTNEMNAQAIELKAVREQGDSELTELARAKREAYRLARFAREMGQLPKTHVLRQLRRDIARIETVLGSRRTQNTEVKV